MRNVKADLGAAARLLVFVLIVQEKVERVAESRLVSEDSVGLSVLSRQKMSRMDKCDPLLFSHGLQLHSPACQLSPGTFVVHPAEYL